MPPGQNICPHLYQHAEKDSKNGCYQSPAGGPATSCFLVGAPRLVSGTPSPMSMWFLIMPFLHWFPGQESLHVSSFRVSFSFPTGL